MYLDLAALHPCFAVPGFNSIHLRFDFLPNIPGPRHDVCHSCVDLLQFKVVDLTGCKGGPKAVINIHNSHTVSTSGKHSQ